MLSISLALTSHVSRFLVTWTWLSMILTASLGKSLVHPTHLASSRWKKLVNTKCWSNKRQEERERKRKRRRKSFRIQVGYLIDVSAVYIRKIICCMKMPKVWQKVQVPYVITSSIGIYNVQRYEANTLIIILFLVRCQCFWFVAVCFNSC